MDPEALYRQLGRLIETMPDLKGSAPTAETHKWLGQAFPLLLQAADTFDITTFRVKSEALAQPSPLRDEAASTIQLILYRALATAESAVSPSAAGAFIPVGSSFEAFAAIAKILGEAKKDVLIVDAYMDETALTQFGVTTPPGIPLRLLADEARHKPALLAAATHWVKQYGADRPLAVRLAARGTLHDRAIFIDGATAWTLTQSLKDFAKRSPAEIIRADDIAELKIEAYGNIWKAANVVVETTTISP
jgi:hypothetical protein